MIPEFSHLLAILSAGLMLYSSLIGIVNHTSDKSHKLRQLTHNTFNAAAFFLFLSFAVYIYLAIQDDFSVAYIASHSNSNLPIFYKVSSIWSAHEGSMFLWITFLVGWLWLFINHTKNDHEFFELIIIFSAILIFGFLLFLLATSSPFERILPVTPLNGADINPVLQDPALAIHPPMLYLGYVGFAIPFIYIISFLINGNFAFEWHREIKSWSLFAWAFLTAGIGLGSWWAYYELGWGGYWFWDPVENVALMPWLAATAFTHSMHALNKSKVLKSWTLFLGLSVFALSLFGAFIVRSGVIDSVHSFANDPERGLFLLIFVALITLFALTILVIRMPKLYNNKAVVSGSKESYLSLNNILMVTSIFSIFIGVMYPLIYETFNSNSVSVGPPFYNTIFAPLIFIAAIIISISINSSWQRTIDLKKILKRFFVPGILSVLSTYFIYTFSLYNLSLLQALGFFSGFLIIFSYLIAIINKLFDKVYLNWPSTISHLGFGLLLLSIAANSTFSIEKNLKMNINDSFEFGSSKLTFNNIQFGNEDNFERIRASLLFIENGKIFQLTPEKRRYFTRGQITSETDIKSTFLKDIYINIGEQIEDNSWTFRLQLNYFIKWIWFSIFLMTFGILMRFFVRAK